MLAVFVHDSGKLTVPVIETIDRLTQNWTLSFHSRDRNITPIVNFFGKNKMIMKINTTSLVQNKLVDATCNPKFTLSKRTDEDDFLADSLWIFSTWTNVWYDIENTSSIVFPAA